MKEIILILDNIRSTHNVGSIFRTADAAGVSKIYLLGVTPDPVDRFGRDRKDIAKVALGAEKTIPWQHVSTEEELFEKLEGFQIVSIEQNEKSVDYKSVELKEKAAIIMGAEVEGVSKKLLEKSDIVAEIPMKGDKESLNVSVAVGVVLYQILKL